MVVGINISVSVERLVLKLESLYSGELLVPRFHAYCLYTHNINQADKITTKKGLEERRQIKLNSQKRTVFRGP